MKSKRLLALLTAGVMSVGMLAGCGSSSGTSSGSAASSGGTGQNGTMTLIMSTRDDFLSTLESAALSYAEETGYKLTSQDAQNDAAKQIQYIETAKNGGDAAIIVNPVDSDAAQSLVDAADGTPLVFVNRAPSDYNVLAQDNVAFCGSNETDAGQYQADFLAEYFKAQGKTDIKYILLQGELGQVSQIKRCAGVLDGLEANGINATSVVDLAGKYDRAEAMNKIAPVLTSGQEFDCIISNNDSMALGAVEACEAAGIGPSSIPIVGVDCTVDGAAAISEGKMAMTVYQNPLGQGKGCIEAALNLIDGKAANTDTEFVKDDSGEDYSDSIIWIPFEPVTADNVADYL
ncbi:MAG: substrate-binding domain-containing protein [Eubacteriales bacterium]|nr:substrate-binding domain-containing protein [Eubacteriales bacterium]